jgi:seryl-tRNA synthetase
LTRPKQPCQTVNSNSPDTSEMSKNINDTSLANLKHYEGKWRSGATRTIRVPIALANATLEYARRLDNDIKSHDTSDLKNKVKQLKDEVERLQNELGNLRGENEALRQELAKEKQENGEIEVYYANKMEDLRLQLVLANAEWQRLKAEEGRWATMLGEALSRSGEQFAMEIPTWPNEDEPEAENETLLSAPPVANFELPEPGDLLNRLKAKRKKVTASLADIEAILEILEELTPDGGD